jgi:hypothetical protein
VGRPRLPMDITHNHSNYESKRYTRRRCSVEALIGPKRLNYGMLRRSS